MRKVVLYISMSVDGFLATKDDNLSWLSIVENGEEDYGYGAMNKSSDTYIVGRKTYDKVLELTGGILPQAKLFKCYVITREKRKSENGVTFYNENIEDLISKLKREEGKNIYCDGGGQIVRLLMEKNLIDEYIISVVPIMLGEGKRLFLGELNGFKLKAKPSKYFESGLVQLHYEKA